MQKSAPSPRLAGTPDYICSVGQVKRIGAAYRYKRSDVSPERACCTSFVYTGLIPGFAELCQVWGWPAWMQLAGAPDPTAAVVVADPPAPPGWFPRSGYSNTVEWLSARHRESAIGSDAVAPDPEHPDQAGSLGTWHLPSGTRLTWCGLSTSPPRSTRARLRCS